MYYLNDFKTDEISWQEALKKAICRCKVDKEHLLVLKKDRYDFYEDGCFRQYLNITNHGYPGEKNIAALIDEMEDFCIDFSDSELIFHGIICPFVISSSKNIVIKNFSLHTEDVFNFQAQVSEVTDDYVLCTHDYHNVFFEKGKMYTSEHKFEIVNMLEYNAQTYANESGLGNQDLGVHASELTYEKVSETSFKIYGGTVKPKVGNYLVLMCCPRIAAGIFINNSRNVSVINGKIYNGFGMGCVAQRSEDIYLTKFCTAHKDGIYFSTNADATHFTNCRGTVMLEDCHFSNQLDDGLNIHGIYTKILDKDDESITVKYMHPAALGIDVHTVGSVIRSVEDKSLLPVSEEKEIIHTEKINFETLKIYIKDTEKFRIGDLVENMTWNAELIVRNCSFKNNKCRGMLIATHKKVLVENCYFHTLGCAVKFECDGKYWYESGATEDVTIRNNVFDHCVYGKRDHAIIEFSPREEIKEGHYYHNKVAIYNNVFHIDCENLFLADNVKEFCFKENIIKSANQTNNYIIKHCFKPDIDIALPPKIPFNVPETRGGGKTSEKLACRDPFILLYGDKYYLYKKLDDELVCMVSDNLEDWSKPVIVFEKPENFHGSKQLFWAPECHYYKGMFYIFTSVFSEVYQHRMISVYRADNPLGPFEDIAGGHITPEDWDAIDGTLYIDEEKQPWMVYVHEWTNMPDKNGAMVAAKLSDDLSHFISEPIELFRAQDPEWARAGITDGPFLYRTKETLYMLWSNFSENGYCVALSQSSNGKLDGEWIHSSRLLYEKGARPEFTVDGGHAMIFMDKEGKMKITLHGPNKLCEDNFEHVMIFDLIEKEGTLEISL